VSASEISFPVYSVHDAEVAVMAAMIADSDAPCRSSRRNIALTPDGLNRSVELTESSYQQAFGRHFRIILDSSYEMVSNMTLA
jgi:hypothetical protein